jgi:hypothetical protein
MLIECLGPVCKDTPRVHELLQELPCCSCLSSSTLSCISVPGWRRPYELMQAIAKKRQGQQAAAW